MPALKQSGQTTAEEHVLATFARNEATTLSSSLLLDAASPFPHTEIVRALSRLERDDALLRYTWDGTEWVTLTLRGLARRGTAAAPRPAERGGEPSKTRPEIIHEHPRRFRAEGLDYCAYILGVERSDGTWAGWIEFVAVDGTRRLRTGQETSQPNRGALAYWASGLEDIYFDGALTRATS